MAPEAHIFWLGQPAHDDDFPACSLVVPGQSERIQQRSAVSVSSLSDNLKLIRNGLHVVVLVV